MWNLVSCAVGSRPSCSAAPGLDCPRDRHFSWYFLGPFMKILGNSNHAATASISVLSASLFSNYPSTGRYKIQVFTSKLNRLQVNEHSLRTNSEIKLELQFMFCPRVDLRWHDLRHVQWVRDGVFFRSVTSIYGPFSGTGHCFGIRFVSLTNWQ
jgi:hypothetical protein